MVYNQDFQTTKSITPSSELSLGQVPYFHSHMHQCLAAQCQEKINVSQKDKILARKTFAREEEKLPLQAASKFTQNPNSPGRSLTFGLQEVQWTCSVRCLQLRIVGISVFFQSGILCYCNTVQDGLDIPLKMLRVEISKMKLFSCMDRNSGWHFRGKT